MNGRETMLVRIDCPIILQRMALRHLLVPAGLKYHDTGILTRFRNAYIRQCVRRTRNGIYDVSLSAGTQPARSH